MTSSYNIAELKTNNIATSFKNIQDAETDSNETLGLGYLYYFNNGTDPSGFVFELTDLDVSGSIAEDPSFHEVLNILSGSGFDAVDATLEYDASASDFIGLFSIQVDSSDVDDLSENDVLFRVNAPNNNTFNDLSGATPPVNVGGFFGDLSFSESEVKSGNVNRFYSGRQQVKYDFVRHLAKQITGGYSSSDIFTNEENLVNGVTALDASLNASLNQKILDAAAQGFSHDTASSGFVRAAHALYHVNIQTEGRQEDLIEDISRASAVRDTGTAIQPDVGPLNIPLRFSPGDRIAIKIAYHPIEETFSGNGVQITAREYKVLFKLS